MPISPEFGWVAHPSDAHLRLLLATSSTSPAVRAIPGQDGSAFTYVSQPAQVREGERNGASSPTGLTDSGTFTRDLRRRSMSPPVNDCGDHRVKFAEESFWAEKLFFRPEYTSYPLKVVTNAGIRQGDNAFCGNHSIVHGRSHRLPGDLWPESNRVVGIMFRQNRHLQRASCRLPCREVARGGFHSLDCPDIDRVMATTNSMAQFFPPRRNPLHCIDFYHQVGDGAHDFLLILNRRHHSALAAPA